jgi:hypothetical protein
VQEQPQQQVHSDNSIERIVKVAERKQGTLSDQELVKVLYDAGFRSDRLVQAFAVVKAESSGRTKAYNPPSNNTGDDSYGIFQINMIGNLGPDRRQRYNLERNEDLFDPERNARVAFEMSNKGKDWGAWTTYTSGKYKQYVKDAEKAFEQFKSKSEKTPVKSKGQATIQSAPEVEGLLRFFRQPYQDAFTSGRNLISRFKLPGMNE